MDQALLAKIIVWALFIFIVLGYYLVRKSKWNKYKGYTTGHIVQTKSKLHGGDLNAYFEYSVGGITYTGSTSMPALWATKKKTYVGLEIPVRYDEVNPERYIVPDPFRG